MFQGLWLSLKNKFRNVASANTDIAGAGREHIHNVEMDIRELINKRDEIAADGELLRNEIAKEKENLDRLRAAVKHWSGVDEAKMQRAYAEFQAVESKIKIMDKRLADIHSRVSKIDSDIARIRSAKDGLRDNLADAAIIQASGRVSAGIENVHTDIQSGPLASAIEYAKRNEAIATASRTRREGENNEDLFEFEQATGTSLADILGEVSTARGHTRATTPVDESPVQKAPRGLGAEHVYVDEKSFIPESSKAVDSHQDRPVETRVYESNHSTNDTGSTTSESSSSSSTD